ncbi:MAG: SGNH/GDSL hydrolase family protein [Microlunatus sp.]|nr:SGNH/GDSL hydrolase family protein [Microlunatus sp.]
MPAVTRIMCFGDSLTWGWIPVEGAAPSTRYGPAERWTGILAAELGDGFDIVEEGLSARAAGGDPTDARLDAARYLPSALASHFPLDLVIMMLGTNDTKSYLHRDTHDIAAALSVLAGQVHTSAGGVGTAYPAPQLLLVSPPPLSDHPDPWFAEIFAGGRAKSLEFPRIYAALAAFTGSHFFDAGTVISTDGIDGVHFTADNNRDLGTALAVKVREIVG